MRGVAVVMCLCLGCGARSELVVGDAPDVGVVARGPDIVDAGPPGPCESLGPRGVELLVNGDFERDVPFGQGPPSRAGVWGGDPAATVAQDFGLTPSGMRALRVLSTSPGESTPDGAATVVQLIDLAPYAEVVDEGEARVQLDAWVYRVEGAAQARWFRAEVFASEEAPEELDPPVLDRPLAEGRARLSEPTRDWQRLHTAGGVPRGTRSLWLQLNVLTDAGPALDGQYLDNVSLRLSCSTCAPRPAELTFGGNLAGDPGFEREPYGGLGIGLHDGWHGDWATIDPATQGVAPRGGRAMLRFRGTAPRTSAADAVGSQVFRTIDLSARGVRPGDVVRASMFVNRVVGDDRSDDAFHFGLWTYRGDPANLRADWVAGLQTGTVRAQMRSDANENTWECLSVETVIPNDAGYLLLEVAAVENRARDLEGEEFDGHFADDVEVVVAPGR